jgi:DNA-binding IclR family transcriptional regulator
MIQVIGRALDILELIAADPETAKPLGDIADTIGLNHGTCANILKTLVTRHYVEKVNGKKGYKLGMMAFRLAGKKDYRNDLVDAAKEEMKKLTRNFNENTLLSVLVENDRIAILQVNSANQLQVITPTRKEAYTTSTGRLLIAMLTDNELENFIHKYGLPKMASSDKMMSEANFYKEVKKTRKLGYVTHLPSDEILGIAVPVYRDGKVIASLSMYLPAFRVKEKLKKEMIGQLKLSAESITSQLS